ncbi:MAG TPA: EamA family transporter [Flavisolibacter sp.]|jgi:drug/metabolite transporter (DMT)-like permease
MKKDLRKAYIALAVVSFFWGTTYLAIRISVVDIPALFLVGVRQFISGLIMVAYFKMMGHQWPDRKSLINITIQGILFLCISNGLMTWALQYVPSGLAAIIAALMPLFVVLFSVLLLRFARFTRLMILGLLIGIGGIATIFYEHLASMLDAKFAFGIGLCLIATMSWSFGTVYASKNKPATHILFGVGLQMLIAGVIMLLICLVSGQYMNLADSHLSSLLSLIYLIVVGSVLTYSAYLFAVSKLPPTLVSIYAYINPLVAIILGWLILHEKMSLNVLIGSLITVGGVYLVNREFKKQQS